eukprot:CAMPEP_0168335636 /NCGR_PEP_ID=MMETSP0213-20121227/11033_1 /TAXON_ID=151035 /ORGANISM="Euplotes harpa, Strain FSP1.4" /LENGTH=328 /DNA_ID=CAMNT_0008340613 /DNA_START=687 /DNA_END=1669 /DNA_ORIENTATION=+
MNEITSVAFSQEGMHLAIGVIKLFDIRYPIPIFEKEHQYKFPIKKIQFHETSRTVFSQDKKVIKVFERDSGKVYTNIQTKKDINDFSLYKNSGMVFTACEEEKLGSYFIPNIGNAPKWCSYIENMTEEMEEKQTTTTYEDYKFLTKNDLEQINASHLIGSKMLKPYMHGYFMDHKQYKKLKSVSDPFAFEKHRKEKIEKKLEELRENRIVFQRTLPKVNSKFMEEVLKADMKRTKKAKMAKEKVEMANELLKDDRFGKLFKDKDFHIDPHSEEYKRNKPTEPKKYKVEYTDDEEEEDDEDKQESNVLDAILGESIKPADKKKELDNRV